MISTPATNRLQERRVLAQTDRASKEYELAVIRSFVSAIIDQLQDLSINRIEQGVDVNNLDEVSAVLRSEIKVLSSQIAVLVGEVRKLDRDKALNIANLQDVPTQKEVSVTNLSDIKMPERVAISNLNEIRSAIASLADEIRQIKIESPVVNVPRLDIPAPVVTVQPTPIKITETKVDFDPVVEAVNSGLEKLKENSETKPIAVRLTDGTKWISSLVRGMERGFRDSVAGIAGVVNIRNAAGNTIDPSTTSDIEQASTVTVNAIIANDLTIPTHDTQVIDNSVSGVTTITYSNGGSTVATKTITVVGKVTTITLTTAVTSYTNITNEDGTNLTNEDGTEITRET